jgi:hypothetical protein
MTIQFWPGSTIPVPMVRDGDLVNDDGWLTWTPSSSPDGKGLWARLEDDVFLHELADTDLADPRACFVFAKNAGAPMVPARERSTDASPDHANYRRACNSVQRTWGSHDIKKSDWMHRTQSGEDRHCVHLAEVGLRIWLLKRLSAVITGQTPISEHAEQSPAEFPEMPASEHPEWVASTMSRFLCGLRPLVAITPTDDAHSVDRAFEASYFEACAVQMFNVWLNPPTWKNCKNCGRLFWRQRSSSTRLRTTPRNDAEFCTTRCTNAFTQRERRNRIAQDAGRDSS